MDRERTNEVLRHMQEAAEAPPPTIQEALQRAEETGFMTHEECEECLEAYIKCFHKTKEIYG